MYERVKTDKECRLENNETFTPVATLEDEYGGKCQISIDDHCYVLRLRQDGGKYRTTPFIFREAFLVLATLDAPK